MDFGVGDGKGSEVWNDDGLLGVERKEEERGQLWRWTGGRVRDVRVERFFGDGVRGWVEVDYGMEGERKEEERVGDGCVAVKDGPGNFDAIVGDVTILADRWSHVEFTEPFIESGLSMVLTVKPEALKAWMFLMPFTLEMWGATGAILMYTMFIVWFLEHRSNPEFSGKWKDRLGNALWFTFSSLFFAHSKTIKHQV
ncbi:hypothetical protein F0562_018351 [Nyssa sinensis]|uniref:Ionotropic glutamate receptor C-terminal domain-containing protein n=1 Tax=Nyssa sinensis TaxID=561372 RepID=A0A5J4ZBM9_9ASTE|nr:hypothetical protein F0562_018351 [Nyssa sinensis]